MSQIYIPKDMRDPRTPVTEVSRWTGGRRSSTAGFQAAKKSPFSQHALTKENMERKTAAESEMDSMRKDRDRKGKEPRTGSQQLTSARQTTHASRPSQQSTVKPSPPLTTRRSTRAAELTSEGFEYRGKTGTRDIYTRSTRRKKDGRTTETDELLAISNRRNK